MFKDAYDLGDDDRGGIGISHNGWPGIEPDEPESTGVQSRWWKWTAPYDGRFTFSWTDVGDHVLAAFSGSSVNDLQPAMLDDITLGENEFLVEAEEGEDYWISIGMHRFAATAFQERWKSCNLKWGPTPTNNTVKFASELAGDQGEVAGSTLYATTERDGWDHMGHASLWYIHEARDAGWVRFWVESSYSNAFRIAAFTRNGIEADLEFVMASRRNVGQRDHLTEVYVHVEEGMQVALRVGIDVRNTREDFTLLWEVSDAPNWLTYVGRLSYGRRDEGGNISRLRGPSEISFNTDGTAVYVSAQDGLHVYRRNTETGALSLVEIHKGISGQSHHIWDTFRSRLYVHHEFTWQTYAVSSENPMALELVDTFHDNSAIYGAHSLGTPRLTLGDNGDYLYRLGFQQQRVYDFSSQSGLQHYGTDRDPLWSIYPSLDGQYWYGLTVDGSVVSQNMRISGSPFFERMSNATLPIWEDWLIRSDHSSKFIFVSTNTNFRVYDNGIDSEVLTQLASQSDIAAELGRCGGIFVRRNRNVVDLLCDNGGFVVKYDSDANEVRVADITYNSNRTGIPDRFGRTVPRLYTLWRGDGVSASPDGRHIYASTQENGVLIFERYGNSDIDLQDASNMPILRLDLLQIGDGVVQFGDDAISEGCFEFNSWTIDDTTYTVVSSMWQRREQGSGWTDIEATNVTSELCVHEPEENYEWRIVADIEIDGDTNKYSSNFFARLTYEEFGDLEVSSGEIKLNGQRHAYCLYLSDTDIEGSVYTVFNSKWQSRPNPESPWSDVDDTETSGEICPLDAAEGFEYRLVGSIMVDGERGHRRSNIMKAQNM